MDCRTVRELADSFLSEQLLVETNHEVLRHVESCAACRGELAARRAIRDRLRGAFGSAAELSPRLEFAAELVRTLKVRRDRVADPRLLSDRSTDSGRPNGRAGEGGLLTPPAADAAGRQHPVSRRAVLRSWWTAAAGVLLAAGGTTLGVRHARARSQLAALAVAAAADHQNCAIRFNLAERPIPLEDAARRYGMPYGQMASFDVPPLTPAAETLERHSCVYGGQRFAHIVLRYRGAVTSLLVTHGDGPSAPQLEPTGGAASVASLPAGGFVAFIVADLGGDDVLRVAQAIGPALNRHLSA
jgi:hypothetical protein